MASNYSRKRAKIKGVFTVKRAVPVRVIKPGQRKPRRVLWDISEEVITLGLATPKPPPELHNEGLLGCAGDTPTADLPKKESAYMKYRRRRNQKWTDLRPIMAQALVEEKSPACHECNLCSQESEEIIRCSDCGPMAYFCHDCCVQHHRWIALHQPDQWKEGRFVPFQLPLDSWERKGHECLLGYTKSILLIDQKGRPHIHIFHFCHCEEEPVTLVRFGFWPATPIRPSIAVSMQLLTSLRSLVFNGQVSLTGFVASLKHQFEAQYSQHPNVVKVFTWDMVLSFNLVHHEVTNLEGVCLDLVHTETCPACPENGKVIAMDGNFSLVRRKRKSFCQESRERHPDRFFFSQTRVDDFVTHYNDSSSQVQDCSNFQAGSVLRSKNKNEKLDVKGIFGSVCRHDYPFKFFDLRHGERMAYPVYLFNQIKDETKMLLYDIACQMKAHLRRRMELPEHPVFAVPIFHVYGHQMHCQVSYNPRRIDGAGLCDGEGTERLWSFLGDFSNITKEMTSENRHDLITELLLHYSTKLTNQMVKTLRLKMEKACLILASTESELQQMITSFPGGITLAHIQNWIDAEADSVKRKTKTVPPVDGWRHPYALNLHNYYSLSQQLQQDEFPEEEIDDRTMELARMEAKLRRIEKKQKLKRWDLESTQYAENLAAACEKQQKICLIEVRDQVIQYTFLCYMRQKYSDGQTIAKRLTKQIVDSSKKVNASIKKYNSSPHQGLEVRNVSRQEALQLEGPIYLQILGAEHHTMDPQIPASSKRKAIDVLNLNKRAREEVQLICQDIAQFNASIKKRADTLQKKMDDLAMKEYLDRYDAGCVALIKKSLAELDPIQIEVEKCFSHFLCRGHFNIGLFLDHVQNLDQDSSDHLNKKELQAILQEIAMYEKEAEEQELEEEEEEEELYTS